MPEIYDPRLCALGEGPMWHPMRDELFWFDIVNRTLMTKTQSWIFDEPFTAAGVIDEATLLLASASALWRFDIASGGKSKVIDLEADNSVTRSNDGRVDPFGGLWIGTMGCDAEPDAGAIYRFYKGELRKLHNTITIPNSICFTPDGSRAYFTDTLKGQIWQQPLDENGWPAAEHEVFVDLRDQKGAPDGAICDGDGYVWSARWGTGEVVRHAPNGKVDHVIEVPAPHTTCPALSPDGVLYTTTAAVGLDDDMLKKFPNSGATFRLTDGVPPRTEALVQL